LATCPRPFLSCDALPRRHPERSRYLLAITVFESLFPGSPFPSQESSGSSEYPTNEIRILRGHLRSTYRSQNISPHPPDLVPFQPYDCETQPPPPLTAPSTLSPISPVDFPTLFAKTLRRTFCTPESAFQESAKPAHIISPSHTPSSFFSFFQILTPGLAGRRHRPLSRRSEDIMSDERPPSHAVYDPWR